MLYAIAAFTGWVLLCWTAGTVYFIRHESPTPFADAFWLPYQLPVALVLWVFG